MRINDNGEEMKRLNPHFDIFVPVKEYFMAVIEPKPLDLPPL